MKTVGERLDFIRRQKGKSYRQLSNLIGDITGDAVRKAIQGNRVKDYYINIISEKLRINRRWVFTGEGNPFEYDDPTHACVPATTPYMKDALKAVEDAHVWLVKLKADKRLLSKNLGAVVGCSQLEFHDALKDRTLSLDQIRMIAKHEGVLDDFNMAFGAPDNDTEELRAYNSIEKMISEEVSREIHVTLSALLERIDEQNMTLTKLMLEIDRFKKQYAATLEDSKPQHNSSKKNKKA